MKNLLPKNFDWTIVAAILLSLGFFGNFWYTNYRYNAITGDIEKHQNDLKQAVITLDDKIKNLAQVFESTLTEEQRRNKDLKRELEDITSEVGVLRRVSTTDRELLRKYSKVYFLNENYVPLSLTAIDQEFRSATSGNYQILSDVYPYLKNLFEDALDDDMQLLAQSAYRSFATQSILKSNYTFIYGAGTANKFSADQGYSEHQLGTALDFTTAKTNGALEGFDKTPEYQWLLDNAYKYGFILSYPAGNAYYKFEPWHWRFVGVKLATRLHDDNTYFYGLDQRVIDSYLANIFD